MNPVHQDSARAELYWLPLGASAGPNPDGHPERVMSWWASTPQHSSGG